MPARPASGPFTHAPGSPGREGAARLRAHGERLWRTRVLARRRLWASALVGVAVLAALRATAPPPRPAAHLWVAARDVPAGTVLASTDLTRAAWPADALPDGLVPTPVGRTVAAGLRRGEPVTDVRVVSGAMVAAHPGRVAVPVRVPDPTTVGLLRVGDRVDLLAADPAEGSARTVARDVVVAALPRDVPGSGQVPGGRVVVVAVAPDEVAGTSVAAVRDFLTVAWRGHTAKRGAGRDGGSPVERAADGASPTTAGASNG